MEAAMAAIALPCALRVLLTAAHIHRRRGARARIVVVAVGRWRARDDVTVRDDVTGEILARVAVDMAAALLGLEGQSYALYTLYTSRSHGML